MCVCVCRFDMVLRRYGRRYVYLQLLIPIYTPVTELSALVSLLNPLYISILNIHLSPVFASFFPNDLYVLT